MTETNAPKLIINLWVLVSISLIFLILRFLCKRRYDKTYRCDDYILAAAWVSVTIYASFITVSTTYGLGKHLVDIPQANLVMVVKTLYIGQTFIGIGLAISKASFAVALLRLVQRRWQKLLLWFFIVSTSISFALVILLTFASCTPVEKLWDANVRGACWDSHALIGYSIFVGSYSATLDVVLALFPSMIIWKVQMNKKEKAGVIVCMSLGFLAGIVSAMKTSTIPKIAMWTDFTYSGATVLIWAAAEVTMTIIAVSIPYFRLAFQKPSGQPNIHESRGYTMDGFSKRVEDSTRVGTAATTATRPDDGSEEFILVQTKDGKIVPLNSSEAKASCDGGGESQVDVHGMV